ncbi:MAG TPA: hypothetical protein VFF68_09690 [Anaerolineaceae bacterium]|nr:hypothetical protein [Anaerolineaceae bacterium]
MPRKTSWFLIGMMAILILSACSSLPTNQPTPTLPPLPTAEGGEGTIPATGASCLVGGWALDNRQIETGWIESRIRRMTDQQINIREIDGSLVVQFLPDGQMIGYAQDFDLQANLQTRGVRIPVQVGVDGSVQAAYQADEAGQVLTLEGPVTGWEDVNLSARALIFPVFTGTADELVQQDVDTNGSVDVEFECAGDTLQLTVDEPDLGRKTFSLQRVQ